MWCDEQDGALLRVPVDCSAADLDAALDVGHGFAEEVVEANSLPFAVEEVAAMDEEQLLIWRREV